MIIKITNRKIFGHKLKDIDLKNPEHYKIKERTAISITIRGFIKILVNVWFFGSVVVYEYLGKGTID